MKDGTPVIPVETTDTRTLIERSQAICAALSDDDDGLKRELLAHAGNRWSLGIVHLLGVEGRLRHAEIGRRLEGVTQRMLTHTLRRLERDGLITRNDHHSMPPRVEYELSFLGQGLLTGMIPLWFWVINNADHFRHARARFDDAD